MHRLTRVVVGGIMAVFACFMVYVFLVTPATQQNVGVAMANAAEGQPADGRQGTGPTVVIKEYEKRYDPFGNGNTIPIYYVAASEAATAQDAREFMYAPLFEVVREDDGSVRITRGSAVEGEWYLEVILDDPELHRVVVEHLRTKLGRTIRAEDVSVLDVKELEATADAYTLGVCPGFTFRDSRILNRTARIRFRASEEECAAFATRLNDGSASVYFTFHYMVDVSRRALQRITGRTVLETALLYGFAQAGQTKVEVTRGQALDFANAVRTEVERTVIVQDPRDLALLTEWTAHQILTGPERIVSVPDFSTILSELSQYRLNPDDPYLTPTTFEETIASKLREVNKRTDGEVRSPVNDAPWGWRVLFPSLRKEKKKEVMQEVEKDFSTQRTESGVEITGIRLFEVDLIQFTDELVFRELVVIEQSGERSDRVERIFARERAVALAGRPDLPVGTVVAWDPLIREEDGSPKRDSATNAVVTRPVPTDWRICDGTEGTPDLRNRFVYGSTADNANKNYGDVWWADGRPATAPQPGQPWTTNVTWMGVDGRLTHNHGIPHEHSGTTSTTSGGDRDSGDKGSADHHNHTFTTDPVPNLRSADTSTLPPYVTLVYLMKVQ